MTVSLTATGRASAAGGGGGGGAGAQPGRNLTAVNATGVGAGLCLLSELLGLSAAVRRLLAVDETAILLTLFLSITIDTPTKGTCRGGAAE